MAEYFTKDGDEYKKVDDNLLTQADVDNVIEKRLERERSKYADYDTIKEKASKVDSTEAEWKGKLDTAIAEKTTLETELGKARLETEKVKIISEFKLSDELAEFVTGESADELRQRAEKLSKGVTGGTIKVNKQSKPAEKETDAKAIAGKLFNRDKSGD